MSDSGSPTAVATPRNRRGLRIWLARFAAVFVVLLIALEVLCRAVLGLGDPPIFRTDPVLGYIMEPGEYHRFGRTIRFNRFSMRGEEVEPRKTDPRELRILVIGDSVPNGGMLTSDEELATTILQSRLAIETNRPVRVLNISAGSWCPDNFAAYLERFGTFDADMAIIVINSLDYAEILNSGPLPPDQPTSRPLLALQEALTNYTPRMLRRLGIIAIPPDKWDLNNPPPEVAARSTASLERTIELLRAANVRVAAVQHLRQSEVLGSPMNGFHVLGNVLARLNVPTLNNAARVRVGLNSGRALYRDDVHPSADGQAVLANVLHDAAMAAEIP